ncbi:TOPRIM nucleotidyl transferase/hydrolase domain-containing protein [Enterovibrio norvegicus]|uniref:TOPRIM nucleotidyl transferase/hydrolase domain-containing protein n=1 Tax=Enterovibrio norvegicus TaxID=188144 RepID=UPI003CC82B0E
MNFFESHISQAFFGGRTLVVEGDAEYSAFNYINYKNLSVCNNEYHDLNIIRARCKVTVSSMIKVLNNFKNECYVLHDKDVPTCVSKRKIKKKYGEFTSCCINS